MRALVKKRPGLTVVQLDAREAKDVVICKGLDDFTLEVDKSGQAATDVDEGKDAEEVNSKEEEEEDRDADDSEEDYDATDSVDEEDGWYDTDSDHETKSAVVCFDKTSAWTERWPTEQLRTGVRSITFGDYFDVRE